MKRSIFVSIKNARVFSSRNDFIRDFFAQHKNVRVLDVGNLGEGENLVPVETIAQEAGCQYTGLDINKNLAEKLGKKNQIIGDLHDLKDLVADKSFDVIYGGEIIEHTWRPGKMIRECNRLLSDDGYLVLDTPNAFDLVSIARLFFKKQDTLGFDVAELTYNEAKDDFNEYRNVKKQIYSQPQHKIFFGPAMLRQLLNMHGFSVEYFAYIKKPRNIAFRLLLYFFPQGSQKICVVAKKDNLEEIYGVVKS